jgi:hypothetical protein
VGRLLVVALAVTLVAGCGGGGGGKRLSKTEFASKADTICRRYNSLSQAVSKPTNLSELGTAVNRLRRILDRSVTDLRKLRPPKDEQATADRWLETVASIRDDLAKVGERIAKQDQQGVQTAMQAGAADQRHGNQLAAQLGMTDCSE